jgi:hypothetical protein
MDAFGLYEPVMRRESLALSVILQEVGRLVENTLRSLTDEPSVTTFTHEGVKLIQNRREVVGAAPQMKLQTFSDRRELFLPLIRGECVGKLGCDQEAVHNASWYVFTFDISFFTSSLRSCSNESESCPDSLSTDA